MARRDNGVRTKENKSYLCVLYIFSFVWNRSISVCLPYSLQIDFKMCLICWLKYCWFSNDKRTIEIKYNKGQNLPSLSVVFMVLWIREKVPITVDWHFFLSMVFCFSIFVRILSYAAFFFALFVFSRHIYRKILNTHTETRPFADTCTHCCNLFYSNFSWFFYMRSVCQIQFCHLSCANNKE